MLNPYFAFGIPLFLLFLYALFALIRKKTTIHYLGFVLLLIAAFMVAFSFQVLQEYWSLKDSHGTAQLHSLDYSAHLLWLPILLGSLLIVVNLWRAIKRLQSFNTE